jgi:CHAT domain-containing protein
VYRALDNLPQALSCFEQGLGEYRAGGDRNGEAADLHNIASIHEIRGEYQQAIEFYSQALPLHVLVKYYAGEANTLHNLAGVYAAMGDYVTALRHYENAREVHRSAGNPAGEATVLTSMAAAYAAARDGRKALEYYDKALPLLRKVSDRGGEATALTNAGRAYAALGENESARDSLASALDLHRSAESRRGQATALAALGPVSDALGNTEEAVHQEEQALQLFREIGDRRGEASALYSLGRLAAAHGRLGPARIQLESALDIVESLRTRVDTQELRSSYLASTREYYELFIDTLMQLDAQQPREGWARKAFEISESARARSLVETLVESVAAIREGVDSSVLERERQLQDQLNAKADRQARLLLGKHSQEEAAAIAKEIATLTSSYRDVEAEIRVKSPRYAALTQPRPVTISEIQQHLLDPDTLLLEYALGEDRSYLWVVSQTDVTTYVLRGRTEIEARARRFYEASKTNSSAQEWRVSAVSLADAILAPASTQLARKRLAIVADGALQYVPFAALPLSKAGPDASLTVSTKETVMLPSASTLGVLRQEFSARPSAPRQLAVIADPVFSADDPRLPAATATRFASSAQKAQGVTSDLARSLEETGFSLSRLIGSRREATAIARLVPRSSVRQLLDFDANRNVALSPEIGNYQILHFATHGLLNSEHPELSGLVLSLVDAQGKPQNGFVRLHDIYNLKLRANLVVLSACQTGLGKDIKGEGLVGFTRGFMYAGAPRVVASLWKVDDRATAELMKRFYAAMFGQEHRSPAAALRQAQQALAADSRWSAPYYWAAFVLQGDWN